MEDLNQIVAENLIRLRKNANLTQQEFATKLNYSNKTISKWELGYAIPNVETLMEIAAFYNVSVDYFLRTHNPKRYELKKKKTTAYKIGMICLIDLFFASIAAIVFVACISFSNINVWPIFLWFIALACLFNAIATEKWWYKTLWPYIFGSLCIWLLLLATYFSLLAANISYNFWYLFFVGLPIQLALILILGLKHSNKKNNVKY